MRTIKFFLFIVMVLSCIGCAGGSKNGESTEGSLLTYTYQGEKYVRNAILPDLEFKTPGNKDDYEIIDKKYNLCHDEDIYQVISKEGKHGVILKDRFLIPFTYDNITLVSPNDYVSTYAIVEKKGKMGYCSLITGRETIPCNYADIYIEEKDNADIVVARDEESDITYFYQNGMPFGDHKITISQKGEKMGIQVDGKEMVPCQYDQIQVLDPLYDHTFAVQKENLWGVIHYTGIILVPIEFIKIQTKKSYNNTRIECVKGPFDSHYYSIIGDRTGVI